MMKHLMPAVFCLTLISSPAFAARHCVGKDGTEVSVAGAQGKTPRARCKAMGGTWKKIGKANKHK